MCEVLSQNLVLTMFFGVLGLIFALAVLNLIKVAILASRGLYKCKPHRVVAEWPLRHHHSRVRDGLFLLVVGGVIAYGIYAHLGFWLTVALVLAGVGLVRILTGLGGRYF